MATTVLTVVGTAVGGPLGGAIGGAIGGLIDQQLFFKNQSPAGAEPTLDDIRISTASEGRGIPFFVGEKLRVAGTVIWMSPDLIEETVEEEVGGKGGDEQSIVVAYEYFVHMAVCWGTNEDADIAFVDEMYANGNLWYKRRPTLFGYTDFSGEMDSRTPFGTRAYLISNDADSDLTIITLGTDVVVSGFTDPGNNGTFFPIAKWRESSTKTVLEIEHSSSGFADETDLTITITQDKPEFRPNPAASVTFYTGTRETTDWTSFNTDSDGGAPSNSLMASEGAAQTRFRELAYTVFEKFAITPYGNQPPQMSALIRNVDGDVPVSDAIATIWGLTGRSQDEIDTSGVDDADGIFKDTIGGWSIVGPTSVREALRPLLISAAVRVRESEGKLFFFTQGSESTVTIETADLAARTRGNDAPRLFRGHDPTPIDMPTRAEVSFIEIGKNYQRGTAIDRGVVSNASGNTLTIEVPIAMTAGQGRKVARLNLWNTITQRIRGIWHLPPKYLELVVGDVALIDVPSSNDPDETDAERFRVLVDNIERGNDWVLVCRGFVEDTGPSTISGDTDASDDPPAQDDELDDASFSKLVIEDLPPLADSTANRPGLVWGTCLAERDSKFRGAALYESVDGVTFTSVATVPVEAKIGSASTVLSDGPTGWIDAASAVDIVIFEGDLSSVTEAQLLGGSNVALLGDEIIGFQTATLVGGAVYRLSNLLRGLRNTEFATTTHELDERFLLIESTTVRFLDFNLSGRGTTRTYKAVPASGSLVDAVPTTITREARNSIPLSPSAVSASKVTPGTNEDTLFEWLRRTRRIHNWWDWSAGILDEDEETYELDFYEDNTFATLVVTKSVTISPFGTVPSFTYSEAEQSSDGLTPGDSFNLEIFQVSPATGRSRSFRVSDLL